MRVKDLRRLISLIVVLITLGIGTLTSQHQEQDVTAPSADVQDVRADVSAVVRVVDGDTIVVDVGEEEKKVRIIGMNAPESVDPRRGVQCFGKEASAHLKALLEGQNVVLTADATQDDVDKYGRLLRYVDLPTMDVARQMILDGYAYEYTYDVPYERQALYQAAMASAESAGAGLWAEDTCNGAV